MKLSKFAPFWQRVAYHSKEQPNGCVLFTGHRNHDGYGRIRLNSKLVFVHREVYKEHHGEIPANMCVCHTCDTPNCINPNHLFLGTHADNMRDRAKKGRYELEGTKNPSAKLIESDILSIRALLDSGFPYKHIAATYKVSVGLLEQIKSRRAWSHL